MMGLLKTIWQADTAFPSGSFAFSNGLEGTFALSGPMSATELSGFIETVLRGRWASADRVALVRAFRAHDDLAEIARIDALVEAATLVEVTRSGSRRNGAAFLTTHQRLGGSPLAGTLRSALREGRLLGHLPVMQGAIWRDIGLDEPAAILASGYTTASGLLNAAVRLGIVGAIQAQGILAGQFAVIEEYASGDIPADGLPASLLPWHEFAAARQARADVRLFAN